MTHAAARRAAAALAELPPPMASFASDNTAGAHPRVLEAMVAANVGHAGSYGSDPWTGALEARFADLFGSPVTVALCFGGTGGNVTALHTLCGRGSHIICTSDAHIALDEAGAPERITGARLVGCAWEDGRLTPDAIEEAAGRLRRLDADGTPPAAHVVSVTQATEVGTVYSPDELAAVCDTAHAAGMTVHVDGARLTNALVSWGYGADRLSEAFRALAATGVDAVVFGGTKAGLAGADAVIFCNRSVGSRVAVRRKQATQTASKMRFLAAQFLAGLDGGAMLDWAGRANEAARRLAAGLSGTPGVALRHEVDANSVFVAVPPAAASALGGWTPFHVWDPAAHLIRFVTSWDTTDDDVDRLAGGVRAAAVAALAGTGQALASGAAHAPGAGALPRPGAPAAPSQAPPPPTSAGNAAGAGTTWTSGQSKSSGSTGSGSVAVVATGGAPKTQNDRGR